MGKGRRQDGTYTHSFPHEPKLLLDSFPRCDLTRCAICTEKIPGVEAGEVLDCAEELVAAYGRSYEFEVVGH